MPDTAPAGVPPSRSVHAHAPDRLLGPLVARVLPDGLRARSPTVPALLALVAAGGALAAFTAGMAVAAGALILLAALLDAVAGTAMAEGRRFGAVVDGVADRYADTLIIAGMALWSARQETFPGAAAVGFTALMGCIVLAYMTARVEASAGAPAARLFAWTGRDVRLLVAAAGALTGQVYVALVALALLTHLPVLLALVRLSRTLRDRKTSPPATAT